MTTTKKTVTEKLDGNVNSSTFRINHNVMFTTAKTFAIWNVKFSEMCSV